MSLRIFNGTGILFMQGFGKQIHFEKIQNSIVHLAIGNKKSVDDSLQLRIRNTVYAVVC
ncbi:Uncharacterised protein [Chlamydia trachomatis]|nr:Uncharacterised protein [Chlamydia trachomatis]